MFPKIFFSADIEVTLKQKKRPNLLEWLGLTKSPDFLKAKSIGSLLGVLVAVLVVLLAIIVVAGIFNIAAGSLGYGLFASDNTGAALRNVGFVVAAIVGFPFIVWRSVVAQKTAEITEQSQITDRINKAVQGLGSEKVVKRIFETPRYKKDDKGDWLLEGDKPVPARRPDGEPLVDREQLEETKPNIEVRIGSILSLERVARDSARDAAKIMGLLAAYIRENTADVGDLERVSSFEKPTEDIQAAVSTIASRSQFHSPSWLKDDEFRPSFVSSNLDNIQANRANFSGAILDWSSWQNANLMWANFDGAIANNTCNFFGANLDTATFDGARLKDVRFSISSVLGGCSFENCTISGTSFRYLELAGCSFQGAYVFDCMFSNSSLYSANFRSACITDSSFFRAKLFLADFSDVSNWEQSQFDQAYGVSDGYGKTLLPKGANYPPHWLDMSELDEEYDELATFDFEYDEWCKRLADAGY